MAIDPETANLLGQSAVQAHMANMANINVTGQNLTQGLGVVNTSVIQAQASVSDDSALIAALQTASRAPVQGANDSIK